MTSAFLFTVVYVLMLTKLRCHQVFSEQVPGLHVLQTLCCRVNLLSEQLQVGVQLFLQQQLDAFHGAANESETERRPDQTTHRENPAGYHSENHVSSTCGSCETPADSLCR